MTRSAKSSQSAREKGHFWVFIHSTPWNALFSSACAETLSAVAVSNPSWTPASTEDSVTLGVAGDARSGSLVAVPRCTVARGNTDARGNVAECTAASTLGRGWACTSARTLGIAHATLVPIGYVFVRTALGHACPLPRVPRAQRACSRAWAVAVVDVAIALADVCVCEVSEDDTRYNELVHRIPTTTKVVEPRDPYNVSFYLSMGID